MDFKLAREDLSSKPKKIKIAQIEEMIRDDKQKILYFDGENSHKDMVSLVKHFDKLNRSIYFKEVKYGLDASEYIYEAHIV